MEKFYFEVPGMNRKEDAIEYINEFYEFKSEINGTGGLNRFLDNYDGWLDKLQKSCTAAVTEETVPGRTYFLVRSSYRKIVGMINIRLALNERLKKSEGNIGYSIRPTERGKGYSKLQLYLGLKVCREYGIDKVLLDADKHNTASWKTMEALGGINIREFYDDKYGCTVKDYEINVNESINKNSAVYEPMIEHIE